MRVTATSSDPLRASVDALVVPLCKLDRARWRLPAQLARIDRAVDGRVAAVLRGGDFRGKRGESLTLYPGKGLAATRLLLVGLGEEGRADAEALRRAAGTAVQATGSVGAETLALLAPALRRLRAPATARALAEGAVLGSYRFDAYQSKAAQKEEVPRLVRSLALHFERAPDARSARAAAEAGVIVAASQNIARDLSNEPANELPPATLARAAQRVAKEVGLTCRVLAPAELHRRKMEAILAVGRGSVNSPRLIVLEHNAPRRSGRRSRARNSLPTICLVGKGITFDSGGISIKPAAGMSEMKHDMSGAAAVVGVLRAAALLGLRVHLVGVIGAAENMPSGSAYRPGDVIRSMSGRTIEVLNTDAEGRVVLADALHFARTEFEPEAIIDLATLTGACVVALGGWCSGLLGTDEHLVERIRRAGEVTGERVWPLPLWEEHRESVKGRVGDIKNAAGREGGVITAAAFLSYFTEDTPWAHLDIAGTGWTDKSGPYQPPGATGVGVRLLVEVFENWRRAV